MRMLDRYRGALLGLAVGDALGAALEFMPPGSFEPIDDLVGGGPHGLEPGQWTDDTSMALCLAKSLIERGGFDPEDQMNRYVRWYREGYLSSTGICFDIGSTVASALKRFEDNGEPYAGSTDPFTAGNGSLMRVAPVPLLFARDPETAIERAADSSRTTHGATEAVDACRYFGSLIVGAVQDREKTDLLAKDFNPGKDLWKERPLAPKIAEITDGSFKGRKPPEIKGSGYVVKSLEAALWAFDRSDNFKEGALMAVNLGDDADTTGAIYGQIAGAFYGVEAIPANWREQVAMRTMILDLADQLFESANHI